MSSDPVGQDYLTRVNTLYGDVPCGTEYFPLLHVEIWLARRLGDRLLFEGVTTAEERRERMRQRIISDGRQNDSAGKRVATGAEETYRELFERLYGVPLQGKTNGE